jgi:hypothetical protein
MPLPNEHGTEVAAPDAHAADSTPVRANVFNGDPYSLSAHVSACGPRGGPAAGLIRLGGVDPVKANRHNLPAGAANVVRVAIRYFNDFRGKGLTGLDLSLCRRSKGPAKEAEKASGKENSKSRHGRCGDFCWRWVSVGSSGAGPARGRHKQSGEGSLQEEASALRIGGPTGRQPTERMRLSGKGRLLIRRKSVPDAADCFQMKGVLGLAHRLIHLLSKPRDRHVD